MIGDDLCVDDRVQRLSVTDWWQVLSYRSVYKYRRIYVSGA